MGRISDIMVKVRDTLADDDGDRWDNNRLLRLIDEAQKDICRQAKLLRTKVDVDIFANQAIIDLPEDLLLLDRVLHQGDIVPLVSHLEMDRRSDNWEADTGNKITEIIYDKQSRHSIKVYPILEVVDVDVYDINSEYGAITDISGLTNDSEYGILTSLTQGGIIETFNSVYGVTTDISESSEFLTCYYLKKPITITDINQDIEIDDVFDNAIKYYVTGKALRDDMDTQNRVVGNEELKFYERELIEAIKDDVMDFTRGGNKQYTASYKGAFDG